jgi:serine/tyrosine/threonine adenylyltransferase
LVDYTIKRHYPEIQSTKNKALNLLNLVIERQCNLVVNWMRVGFIHGVMNTDNMAISGETIDYGPCAFMDRYNPKTVFSSIDQLGRYSFSNQPPITKWNLARFAECLLPLIHENEDVAIKITAEIIDNFQNIFEIKWLNMMRDKLGLFGEDKNDLKLINNLLSWMENNEADYTNTFCYLMKFNSNNNEVYNDINFKNWLKDWEQRTVINGGSIKSSINLMKKNNPIIIPRNHKVELALEAANNNNLEPMNLLLSFLEKPYTNQNGIHKYQEPSNNTKYQTFCGT